MPTYEFKCDQCGTMAMINRSIDADGDVDAGNCMACAIPMTRIWAATLHARGRAAEADSSQAMLGAIGRAMSCNSNTGTGHTRCNKENIN